MHTVYYTPTSGHVVQSVTTIKIVLSKSTKSNQSSNSSIYVTHLVEYIFTTQNLHCIHFIVNSNQLEIN